MASMLHQLCGPNQRLRPRSFRPSEICPGLYVGGAVDVANLSQLWHSLSQDRAGNVGNERLGLIVRCNATQKDPPFAALQVEMALSKKQCCIPSDSSAKKIAEFASFEEMCMFFDGHQEGATNKEASEEGKCAMPQSAPLVAICNIAAIDEEGFNIYPFLSLCVKAIAHWHVNRKEAVVVHCAAGVSRSVTVTSAYIWSLCSGKVCTVKPTEPAVDLLPVDYVIRAIQGRRVCANPNPSFRHQLVQWTTANKHTSIVQTTNDTSNDARDASSP